MLVTVAWTAAEFPEIDTRFALCYEGQLAEELRSAGAAVHNLGAVRASRPWTVWRARRRSGVRSPNSDRLWSSATLRGRSRYSDRLCGGLGCRWCSGFIST